MLTTAVVSRQIFQKTEKQHKATNFLLSTLRQNLKIQDKYQKKLTI